MNKQTAKIKRRVKSDPVTPGVHRAQNEDEYLSVIDENTRRQFKEMDALVKEKDSWALQISELRDSLSTARQELKEQRKESNAASELLRIHLNQLQDELRSKQQQPIELAREKEMLLQQNGHLQEQLKHCLLQYKEASIAVETLSKFVENFPRLQLLNRVNNLTAE